MQKIRATEVEKGTRLDVFVLSRLPQISRSFIARLIEQGKILVNGEREKPGYHLKVDDRVLVEFDPESLTKIESVDIPVLYEDDDVIVVNKPEGILTHSKGAFNPEATVATFIAPKLREMSGERAGIVHRLDRATSGVMVCAKNQVAQTWLQKQFSVRKVLKSYVAVIEGSLTPAEAIIDMPIARNPRHPKTFHIAKSGRPAITEYHQQQSNDRYSLLLLHPKTGRTHQLRVHLSSIGHPIVGDTLYGGKSYERMLLHAHKLELTLPNKKRQQFVAEIPPAFHTIFDD